MSSNMVLMPDAEERADSGRRRLGARPPAAPLAGAPGGRGGRACLAAPACLALACGAMLSLCISNSSSSL
jgi:hypothetical protein